MLHTIVYVMEKSLVNFILQNAAIAMLFGHLSVKVWLMGSI